MRLVLGTAQFGATYGVANADGKPDDSSLREIFLTASKLGVTMLDTAAAYGESEARIGHLAESKFQVVTKLPDMTEKFDNVAKAVNEAIDAACDRINKQWLYGLLLHRPKNLMSAAGPELWASMLRAQDDGRVAKIGYSVYDPAELKVLVHKYPPSLVQLPFNVFDQRFSASGWTRRLKESGCEVHARSIFLQGLLLQEASSRHPYFNTWEDAFSRLYRVACEAGCSVGQFALALAKSDVNIDRLVCGVDSQKQLLQICDWLNKVPSIAPSPHLAVTDDRLILPQNWLFSK